MGKHTPGPWRYDGQAGVPLPYAEKNAVSLMVRGRNCTIAEVIPHGDATAANAQLIAAAPDMARALSDLLGRAQRMVDADAEDGDATLTFPETSLARARAALKEAGVL